MYKFFGVIPWNSGATYINSPQLEPEYLIRLGEIIYGLNNTVRLDIKFVAQEPGFIVQHIERIIIDYTKNKIMDFSYYEIFYITPENLESFNADSYLIAEDITLSIKNGSYTQIGTCSFYPYAYSENVNFDKDGVMKYSKELQNIFGENVKFGKLNTLAAGLPYSLTPPEMNNLAELAIELRRIVIAKWDEVDDIEVTESFMYIRDGVELPEFSLERFNSEKLSSDSVISLASLLGSRSKTVKGAMAYLERRSSRFYGV